MTAPTTLDTTGRLRSSGGKAANSLITAGVSLVIVLAAWVLFLKVFNVDPFSGRTPGTVWDAMTSGPQAAANRSELWTGSLTTLRHAFFGLAAGMLFGLCAAVIFTLSGMIERSLMPIALVMQTVPIIVLMPIINLVFGRGLGAVMVITGIVTFFPTLVNVSLAMKNVPAQSLDLMRAYGASRATTLFKARFPAALPALFASFRIAAPLALIGALLAEWLSTGDGLGYLMLINSTNFNTDLVWAAAALVTAFSVVLYGVISAVEAKVLAAYSITAER